MLGLLKYSVASKRYISIVAIKRGYYRQKQGIVATKQALLDLEYVTLPEVEFTLPEVNKLFIFLFVRFIIKLACRVYQLIIVLDNFTINLIIVFTTSTLFVNLE